MGSWKKEIGKILLGSAASAFGETVGHVLAAKLLGVTPDEENEEKKQEETTYRAPD